MTKKKASESDTPEPEATGEDTPAIEPAPNKALDALTGAALERLKRATDGRNPNGYTAVRAEDVLAVAVSLSPDKASGVTVALLTGAAGAGTNGDIHQRTDHLLHLIEQAG